MYPFHMILQVPSAGKAVPSNGSVAVLILAQIRLLSVSMHPVGFPLMTQQAGCRRKWHGTTGTNLASIGLQVRIQVFAGRYCQ